MVTITQKKTTKAPHRFDSLEQEAFLSLWRTYDRLRALEDELFTRHDLTPQQYNAMRLLQSQAPDKIRTLDLAPRLLSPPPYITPLIAKPQPPHPVHRDHPTAH